MDLNKFISVSKSELISALLLFVLLSAIVLGSRLHRLTSGSALAFEEQVELIVEASSDIDFLLSELEKQETNYNEQELKWASNILGWRKIQRGRYLFEGSYSYNALLSKLARGIQDPVTVIVVPGIDPQRFTNSVADKFNFSNQKLLEAMTDSAYLDDRNLSPEQLFGRMYPETYSMYWTSTPKEVLNKILRQFNRSVTDKMEEQAKEKGISIDEVITMASIVEWEANEDEEKPIISGLYWNRLDKGMRLQADPTINYVVGERRRLLYEDYKLEHEYNTYLNAGLPPGPITNPGIGSIRAALNPADHNFLFMVAKPSGGHVFTKTFEEHKKVSREWREWLREQHRIKKQQETESEAARGESETK